MLTAIAFITSIGVLPQTGAVSRVTATVDAVPRIYSGTDTAGVGGLGRVTLALHPLVPVVDDGAPLDLQPFLQRVSSVGITVGGAYDRIRNVRTVTATQGSAGVVADFVIARGLVLGAQVGWSRLSIGDDTPAPMAGAGLSIDSRVPVFVGLTAGFRLDAVRVDFTWEPLHKSAGDYAEEEHRITTRVRGVIARRLDLAGEFHWNLDSSRRQSFGGWLSVGWYPTRRLGLRAEVGTTTGSTWSGSETVESTVGAALRGSWWATPRVGLNLGYAIEAESGEQEYVRHSVLAGATFRLGW